MLLIRCRTRNPNKAIGVLGFMFYTCWELSLLTLVSIPAAVLISKVFGDYYKRLSKDTQSMLARANSVAEETLSSVVTVRAFAGEEGELDHYEAALGDYFAVNTKMALTYAGFATLFTLLPNLVTTLVLLYGGELVLAKQLAPGQLVSFMLYQQSLSSAFNMMGTYYTGLTSALGAADKVRSYVPIGQTDRHRHTSTYGFCTTDI